MEEPPHHRGRILSLIQRRGQGVCGGQVKIGNGNKRRYSLSVLVICNADTVCQLSFGESAMNPHAHGMGLHSIGKEPPKMCLSVSVTIYLNLQDSITRADHRRGRGIRAAAAVDRIILRRRVWTGTNGRRRRVRS